MILEILVAGAIVSGPASLYLHYRKIKSLLADLKTTHVTSIESHVKEEIKAKLAVADIAVCDFCHRPVARFEPYEGKTRCSNCKYQGVTEVR